MELEERTMTQHPGAFIVLEGVDGAGKTTIATKLLHDLKQMTNPDFNGVLYVKEPGSTSYGNAIREAFLHQKEPLSPMTEVLGLLSAKNELITKIIRPAVTKGWIVIADRYTRSLMAYQGGIRGVPYETITQLLEVSDLLIPPHFEIFLDVDEKTQRTRRDLHLNAMDKVAVDHADKLREGFRQSQLHLPTYRSITVNANRTFDAVYADVLKEVKESLKFHRITGQSMPKPHHGPLVRPNAPQKALLDDVTPSRVPDDVQ